MAQLAIAAGVGVLMFGAEMLLKSATGGGKGKSETQNVLMGSSWGASRPILYGTSRLGGMMIWSGPIKALQGKTSSGGKGGGGSSSTTETVQYSASFAVAFCEGPVTSLTRMWANGVLIYDATNPADSSDDNNLTFIFHPGDNVQTPDSLIELWVSENVPSAPLAAPAFRGTGYVIFHDLNLNPYSGAIPQISAELSTANEGNLPIVPFALNVVTGSPFTNAKPPFCVDWVRGVLYATDANVGYRMLSLQTMAEMTQIPATYSLFGPYFAMACGQGTYLYVYNDLTLYQYSPDTLQMTAQFGPNPASGNLTNTLTGFAATDSMAVVTVVGSLGSQDFVVCGTYSGGYGIAGAVPGGLGFCSASGVNAAALAASGADAFTYVVAGAQDQNYSEAWLLNAGSGISQSTNLYIYRVGIAFNANFTLLGGVGVQSGVSVTLAGTLTTADMVPGSTPTGFLPSAGSGTSTPNGYCYDATDDTLIIQWGGATIKWSAANGVVWRQSSNQGGALHPQSRPNGSLGFPNGEAFANFTYMDAGTGAVLATNAPTPNPGGLSSTSYALWDGGSRSTIYIGTGADAPVRAYLDLGVSGPWTLADILTDICLRGGLSADQIDVSQITGNVPGFLINEMTTCKDAIAQLQAAYFFDVVESDFTLKFVPRGASPALTIEQASLASVTGPDNGNYWQHTRAQEQDLPLYAQMNFTDMNNEYMQSAAYAQRISDPVPTTLTKQRQMFSLPLAMGIDDALVVVQTALWTMWAERDSYDTTLGWQFAYLDPTDVVAVALDNGETYTARINAIAMGADFTLKVELQGTDVQTYSQTTDVVPPPPAFVQTVRGASAPRFFPLNLPLLRDQDYTAGAGAVFYYGAGSYNGLFQGATLNQSAAGTSYTQMGFIATQLTYGNCLTTLPAPPSFYATDRVGTLTVSMVNQTTDLVSVTDLELLNGANAAVVGNEIIQFMTVTPNDDNSYTLSGLLRGRKGTEWACDGHTANEPFFFLDTNLQVDTLPLSDNNTSDYYKLQAVGTTLDATLPTAFTFLGWDQKPYAPVAFNRAMSGSDLVVGWSRRTRASGNLTDGTGLVPLFEETEAYDAYIVAAPYNPVASVYATPATIVRSFMGLSAPAFTYTAAMMATDGFAPATATLYLVVFQNSVTIGHGWPGAAALPAF